VGLGDAAHRQVGEFSLGMHQRLGIGTALLGDPDVLVLDEPLNGLDPEGIRWMRTLMRDLARDGCTILFSSHLMSEMALTADDLIVVGEGRLIAQSTLEEFVRTNTTQTATVRTPAWRQLAAALVRAGHGVTEAASSTLLIPGVEPGVVGRVAAAEGIALEELGSVRDSLEDIFLRLTDDATGYKGHAA
jgi:ABC-2 type transport system ATP-binding protein